MSTAKMIFHGSDIEKICEVYQLKPEEIVNFGANVNPLGLSEHVKEQLAGRLDILSSYPDRDYTCLLYTSRVRFKTLPNTLILFMHLSSNEIIYCLKLIEV